MGVLLFSNVYIVFTFRKYLFDECKKECLIVEVGILLTSHPDPKSEPYPHQAIHARVTREIVEAEQLGYDSIWISEHHFSNSYGILPDPFSYLAYLAAKTSRIKLGAAVMVVPLHHPMRIVENAAFIDIGFEANTFSFCNLFIKK